MHAEAFAEMARILDGFPLPGAAVLDVGSLDINGSYRELVERRGWTYTGLDVRPGANVDVVSTDPYHYPLPGESFDVVISGSTLEHVAMPWRWLPELARVLRPGGLLAIITHTRFELHRYPIDCWRVLPDGMAVLFDVTGCLRNYQIRMYCETDISGVAQRVL